jgi:phenylacetate-CoA ligase
VNELLDILRTQYLRLPASIKAVIGPVLSIAPLSVRFGRTYITIRGEISRSETDAQFVRQYQLSALRQLLRQASERSRHFSLIIKERFGLGFDPFNFTMSDLSSLPILTKTEIIDDPEGFLIAEADDYDIRSTSGSSGNPPARIFLDRGRSVREIAFLHHIWSRIDYRQGDGRAVLRDYGGNIPSARNTWRYDPALRELWLSPFHLTENVMDQYLQLLHDYKVRFIFSYPSALNILARHAIRRRWKPPRSLRGILAASETLFTDQRKRLIECFKVQVIAHYGMSERVAIAGEVAGNPDLYEFEPLYGVVELVDDEGKPVTTPGQRGRLISTGLFNKAMALIRYDTGDRATLVRAGKPENAFRLQVCDIRSRWNQEFVVGYDGQKIPIISLDQENHFGIFTEYQYAQSIPGKAVFRVVLCNGVTKAQVDATVSSLQEKVRGVVDFDLEVVSHIPVGSTGKRDVVLQQIPDSAD